MQPLDRDAPSGRAQWNLNVDAMDRDSGQVLAYAHIRVHLRDINDHEPVFDQSTYEGVVREGSPSGTLVVQARAVDHDDHVTSTNGRITYAIDTGTRTAGQVPFHMDGRNGTLSTDGCCLDREQQDQYSIKISATDGAGLRVSARMDANSCQPQGALSLHCCWCP